MGRTALFVLLSLLPAFAYAGCGGLVELSVYDRTERRELATYHHLGHCYVVGKPGNEYRIVVRNRTREDVLAVVSVDGVNAITGETASPVQSGYVAGSGQAIEIEGWRKSLQRVAAFYFTSLGDSYASRTGRPENVGVIGAAVFRRKLSQAPLAESERRDESSQSADRAARDAPAAAESKLGTGHGRNVASRAQYTTFERATEAPEEVTTIYYDSMANLVAEGVIPPLVPDRQPLPFPARFVADPPKAR